MINVRRVLCLLVGLSLLVAFAACQRSADSGNDIVSSPTKASAAKSSAAKATTKSAGTQGVIKIYSSLPRTGNARQQTDSIVNAVRMALDEANHRIGDFRIEYEDHDDATASAGSWTAEQENANAKEAAADPDVMVYIGPYNSNAAKNSMPILNEAGLLMISPANTSVGLTKPNADDPREPDIYRPSHKVNYTRVVPTDDLQGRLGADWAKQMGVKTVFVLDDHEMYGRGLAKIFMDRCEQIGIEVLGSDSVDAKSLEFRPLMTAIKAKRPDLIYFGGTTQSKGGQIAKDMVAVGLDAKLMAPDGCMETAFIESAGAENLNDRCYVTFGGLPAEALEEAAEKHDDTFLEEHAAQWKFSRDYKKRFGRTAEAYAVYGYEAAKVALEAIRKAGKKDRAAIVAACLGIRDFSGLMGHWSFDANGDTTAKHLSGNIVHNGKFKFMKMLGGE